MANLVPLSKSSLIKPKTSAIIKADKFLAPKSSAIVKYSDKSSQTLEGDGILNQIQKKVIKIDKLLKSSLLLKKKGTEKKRVSTEKTEFEQKEKDLEKNKPKAIPGIKLPSPPKLGIFDWIKNFITQTLLGFVFVRLYEHLPKLLKLVPIIFKAGEFLIDIGGKLLDGLVTFVDWGYKAYDATRGFVKNIFGEGGVKQFDNLMSTLNTLSNVIILASLASIMPGGPGGFGKGGGASAGSNLRPGQGGRPRITTSGGAPLGRPDLRNPFRQGPKVTIGGGSKFGAKTVLKFIKPFTKRLPIIGGLIDFGLSVALGEDPGRAAFKAIGATLVGALGAAIGSIAFGAGAIIGGIIGGIGGDILGGALYDMFFRGKKPSRGKVVKVAGGGKPTTRGGRLVSGPTKRTIKKKKKTRTLSFTPRKIKPGASVGGEEKVRSVFPNPEKAWWDPFGLFAGKQKPEEKPEEKPEKPKEKQSNPQEFLIKSNDTLGRSNFFGPFFTLAIKSVLGQKPDQLDYKNAGKGLNTWVNTTFKSGTFGFAGGGEVDASEFFSGEDYTNVIAKSVEDSVSKEVETTIRNLSKELSLKPVGKEEMIQENIKKGTEGTEDGGGGASEGGISGTGVNKGISVAKKLIADLGISPAQASGIVGNFLYESAGMTPGEKEGSPYGVSEKPWPLGTLGRGYGWAQWTNSAPGDRLDKFLKSYGGDKGKIATDDDNYRFLMKELKGSESLTKKGVITGTYFPKDDPQAASDWFRVNWERAGVPADTKRRKETLQVYEKIKGLSREQAKAEVEKSGGKIYSGETSGAGGTIGGSGKFIQGNSGSSRGVHFHIGPGSQQKGTILQSKYNADARASAAKVVDHFLSKGSTIYDGRRGTYYKSSKEVAAAQRAHSASGSQGGIDLQVDFEKPHPFPLRTLGMAFRPNGFGVSADIAGSNSFVAHGRYDEKGRKAPQTGGLIAYEKGGETLDGPHMAMIGEKGKEFVIDADSTAALEGTFPGFLAALNEAKYNDAIQVLRNFVSYEQPYAEPEVHYVEVPVEVPVPMPMGGGGLMMAGGGGIDNTYDTLEML